MAVERRDEEKRYAIGLKRNFSFLCFLIHYLSFTRVVIDVHGGYGTANWILIAGVNAFMRSF